MKTWRIAADTAMTVLLPCLMAYSLIGETFHEAAGVTMLVLFIAHHILNRAWYKGLFRGRCSPYRAYVTLIDLLLCAVMLCQPLSGIAMSKHLFAFLPTAGVTSAARTVHLLCGYWGFALLSVHLGVHLDRIIKKRSKWLGVAAAAVSLYGVYAFVKRELPQYMTLRTPFVFFDYAEPRVFFFMDYLAVMVLLAMVGYGIGKALRGSKNDRYGTDQETV